MGVELLVVGCSHRTAPIDVRESVAFPPEQVREALRVIREEQVLQESLILSTCNRTEIYARALDPSRAEGYIRDLIARLKGGPSLGTELYTYRDQEMVRHLFRVASGLDSMKLGEIQILGQVKSAYELARESGSAGLFLNRLLATALHAGKRARTETEIGVGAVSIASAAAALAGKVFQTLSGKCVLIVGAGDTGRLAARHFAEEHPGALLVANRTFEKATAVAKELGGQAVPLSDLRAALTRADVVVCATAAPGLVVTREMVDSATRGRRNRPLVFVDIAVPRDVDPEASRLENVFVYSIDALHTIVDQNLSRRSRELPKVEAIVEQEALGFFRWKRSLQVIPTVVELRERFEQIRAQELERHLRHFAPGERERIEALTRGLVNKLLHQPTTKIKSFDTASDEGLTRLEALREAFGLGSAGLLGDPG
jgi:glutamyl-tRNA reductase